jgi:hypothetical protein
MKKKLLKYTVWLALGLISILGIIGTMYLVNPKNVENQLFNIFYPPVEISKKYKGNIVVEAPEVYELMQIACSLTQTCQDDPNLINQNSGYHTDFTNHFKDFENHELVSTLNDFFVKHGYATSQHSIRLNSLNYNLDSSNNLSLKNFLIPLSNPDAEKTFLIPDHIKLIEDFSKKSSFKDFYQKHNNYYNKLINNYHELCDFQNMKNWLENKFASKYQSYRIIFSSLTAGFHSTARFRTMQQTFMFVSAPRENIDGISPKEFEIASSRSSRVVFTEIDHNYVNPLTDLYLDELDDVMSDFKFWNGQKDDGLYQSNYKTFNEYMTWGVFNLYALDTYTNENTAEIIKAVTDQITDRRKFIRFRAFNQELIRLYKSNNKPKIEELYQPILEWMKKESESKHVNK